MGNVNGARLIFERWMKWQPNEQAWQLYLKFEKRYKEKDRARTIYARFVGVHPETKNWLRWARFEEDNGYAGMCGDCAIVRLLCRMRDCYVARATVHWSAVTLLSLFPYR